MMKNRIKQDQSSIVFKTIGYIFIAFLAIMTLFPFYILVVGSFTAESQIYQIGFTLWPREISYKAYEIIFKSPKQILNAYTVTVFITATGTIAGLFITAMTAYVLNKKEFRLRNHFAFFFYFTTLFNAGMIPTYILIVRYLGLKNNILALILPNLLSVFNILIMRNFVKSIPYSIIESGKMDGASDFKIFRSLYLPLMEPALACIGLFIALRDWNDWSNAMLYVEKEHLFPLQFLLYQITNSARFMNSVMAEASIPSGDMPQQSIKLAMTVVSIGPIVLLYPFLQKYFVTGIMIGSVKE